MRPRPHPALVLAIALPACGNSTPPAPPTPSASAPPTSASASAPQVATAAPSASSPDVVTQASEPYVAGPSVLASGSVDGAALRKRHIERLTTDTSAITVLQGQSALELGKRICEAVTPKRPPATPVLLKPNLCGFDSIKDPEKHKGDDGVHGRTTDVEFTRGVVQCLKARGHKAITIAEGCGISHKHWENVIALTGYDVMAKEEGVSLVAMDDDGVFDVEGDQPGKPLAIKGIGNTRVPTLLLPKTLAEHLDHGLFLSLPKIKAHRYSVVSLGIKGMQGTVMLSDQSPAYKQKWRMHKELTDYFDEGKKAKADGGELDPQARKKAYMGTLMAFAERMVDTLEISLPDAILADGAPAMAGDGFQSIRPTAEKVAIGGTNPVLVDRVGAAFLGVYANPQLGMQMLGHKTSPLIEAAAKRYKLNLDAVTIVGDGATLLDSPRPFHFKSMNGFAIDFDPPGVTTPAAPDWASFTAPAKPSPGAAPKAPADTPPPASASAAPPADTAPPPESRPMTTTPSGKPEVHASALGSDTITLDGSVADPAWARVVATSWDTDYSGARTGVGTRARFLWSKDALYVLFELSSAGLFTDTARPTTTERKGLYQEDCVEIFLTPNAAQPKHYFEIELGPFGHYFDLDVDREHKKEDKGWSSGATIATRRDPGASRATIEARLTAPAILAALSAGARLPLGLYRMEGKTTRKYLAWSPPRTAKPNFHVPEAFGMLILDP